MDILTDDELRSCTAEDAAYLVHELALVSSVITCYDSILSGKRKTSRERLIVAAHDGIDYFAEVKSKRDSLVAYRVSVAEKCISVGGVIRKMRAYENAANATVAAHF